MQFSKEPLKVAVKAVEIPPEMIEECKKFIAEVEQGKDRGVIALSEGENPALVRQALVQAGTDLKKYISVRKVRGQDNALSFEVISRKEFLEAQNRIKARVAKVKGKKRPGRSKKVRVVMSVEKVEKKKPGRKPGRPAKKAVAKKAGRKAAKK